MTGKQCSIEIIYAGRAQWKSVQVRVLSKDLPKVNFWTSRESIRLSLNENSPIWLNFRFSNMTAINITVQNMIQASQDEDSRPKPTSYIWISAEMDAAAPWTKTDCRSQEQTRSRTGFKDLVVNQIWLTLLT